MNQIVPHRLWVGHAGDERNFRQLFDAGIRAVIALAVEETPGQPPHELIFCRFPLVDGTGNDLKVLALAMRTAGTLAQNQVPTLICGGAGLSRAPSVAAAALALAGGEAPAVCLERVAAHHACDVSPGLWKDVTALLASWLTSGPAGTTCP
jgi:hypothetical protein